MSSESDGGDDWERSQPPHALPPPTRDWRIARNQQDPVMASDSALLTLRSNQVDKETLGVTYVSTDSVRVTGGVEFEVYKNKDMILSSVWVSGADGGCLAQWKCRGI
ncbi:C-terminal binding protein AN-like [Pyrus ussuriensis x Pyrus communis]|uniref:C-terminal binding protein AN-like n=1 Tax=Pyrus ussuriensis x Pyrus communis TaxID=2448454 RepID=A0A5N5GTY2_9ROSA|nr:C-terminal binding protein AN-like [Pyrus ussuriensis x Pyrus communis]